MWVNKKSPISIVLRTEKNKGFGLLNGVRITDKTEPLNPSFVFSLSGRTRPSIIKIEICENE